MHISLNLSRVPVFTSVVVCPFRNNYFMDRIYQILKGHSLESIGVSVGLIILNLKLWFFVLIEVTSVLQPSEIQS